MNRYLDDRDIAFEFGCLFERFLCDGVKRFSAYCLYCRSPKRELHCERCGATEEAERTWRPRLAETPVERQRTTMRSAVEFTSTAELRLQSIQRFSGYILEYAAKVLAADILDSLRGAPAEAELVFAHPQDMRERTKAIELPLLLAATNRVSWWMVRHPKPGGERYEVAVVYGFVEPERQRTVPVQSTELVNA